MVKEYYIVKCDEQITDPDFFCFKSPLDLAEEIYNVFNDPKCKWSNKQLGDGLHLTGEYNSELALLDLLIMKPKKDKPYIFQLTVLGGTNPLQEVARLCKGNKWNAFEIKTSEYLNLENPPLIRITKKDKSDYYDSLTDIQINNVINKQKKGNTKWWIFWR